MLTSESTTSQSKNNYHLIPIDGFQTRVFPSLKYEIGRDPAELLLQLDYWITTAGVERDGYLWVKKSAKGISRAAFQDWSVTKVQRVLRTLANEQHLIIVAYFDAPRDATPYIRLNLEAIEQLKSIRYAPTCGEVAAPPAKELPTPPAEPPHPPSAVPDPSTAELPHPPAANLPGHIKDISNVSADALGDQTKVIPEKKKESEKGESALRADRAKRGTSSLNGEKQVVVGENTETIQTSGWDEFCEKLAEICGIDFEIEPGHIRTWASKIWKKGNNSKGYTIDDLDDFIVWWNTYDWRGAKNKTLPRPKQVVECIRQSYEHESTITRRELRARGFSPDESRYRYITGEYASYIKY